MALEPVRSVPGLDLDALQQELGGSRGSASRGGAQNGDGHARVGQDFLVLPLALSPNTLTLPPSLAMRHDSSVPRTKCDCGAEAAAAAAHDRRVESLQLGV